MSKNVWRGGTNTKIDWTKVDLRKLYQEDGLTLREIAEPLGVTPGAISYRMWLQGISTSKNSTYRFRQILNKANAKELYLVDKLSLKEIGDKLGISYGIVRYYLISGGVTLRNPVEALRLAFERKIIQQKGPLNAHWKGGKTTSGKSGYTLIWTEDGYVFEHWLVWEKAHPETPKNWIIHHINGVKTDNRLENLIAMPMSEHRLIIPKLQQRIRELEKELSSQCGKM